ncbi:MAG: hypothetical protein QOD00_2777 [Blastocatellia bacterium]|nr:hypothetical protein [Blastocatellia bacterium]
MNYVVCVRLRLGLIAYPVAALLLAVFVCAPVYAQGKLPAPERVVGDYLKATGGKKRQAGIRDATYDYELLMKGQKAGRARTQVKANTFARTDTIFENDEKIAIGSNGRSAWELGADGHLNTLTDALGNTAKLRATLEASRLLDYKKLDVLARTVGLETAAGEPAYVLEFSARNGARLRYRFGSSSHLLLKIADDARQVETSYSDYRAEGGILEPHRVEVRGADGATLVLVLQRVSYNTGLALAVFDPPAATEAALDIPALLHELELNQKKIDERVAEYSFVEKRTEREINSRGEVTKEKQSVHEVYPLVGSQPIYKLISEDGVPLNAERAAKRDKEIAEFIARYEKEREKKARKEEELKSKGEAEKKKKDDEIGINVFLRACELISPRREQRGKREAVVFDFRPRQGFHPSTQAESIVAKLVGIMWIDPVDKVVMRLEARLAEGFKVGGGLVASISPGSAFAFEQVRQPDGVWLPRFAQVNFKARVLLFKGLEANETREYSDYKRFSGEASGYQLDKPKP